MVIIWILVGLLLLSVYGKWVILILLSPVIIMHLRRERRISNRIYENDQKILRGEEKVPQWIPCKQKNFFKKSIGLLIDYLASFERYILLEVGYLPSHSLRKIIYKYIFLVKMKKGAVIYYGAEIRGSYNLFLEKGAIVGDRCVLDARRGYIKIGKNVQLGNFVNLWTGSHDYNDPYFRSMPGKRGPIEIEDYCWLGPRSTVLYSVIIGKGAVVGAGSIVTKNVSAYSIVTGIPAKKVAERSKELYYKLGSKHLHFY